MDDSTSPSPSLQLALLAATTADEPRATLLSHQLNLPLLPTGTSPVACAAVDIIVVVDAATLCLQETGSGAPGPVGVEFGSSSMRHRRRSGANELLGRAVGVGKKSPLRILDATAGLGRDAFVLADLGCEVVLCERDPLIVELLRAGLQQAADSGDSWLTGVVQRMSLLPADATTLTLPALPESDVIYLDPMFPQRTKQAAVKKEMALFQLLLDSGSGASDADALLAWALACNTARVVVKRPAKAGSLAGPSPSHAITGSAVRYDVYVHRKLA